MNEYLAQRDMWMSFFLAGVVSIVAVSFVRWASLAEKQKHEQRQRQKKFDRQNNIGRRIYNALDRLVNRLELTQLHVDGDVLISGLYEISVVRYTDKISEVYKVITVVVNLIGDEDCIRVTREGQWFEELWPEHDVALEELIPSLENYIRERFAPWTIEKK